MITLTKDELEFLRRALLAILNLSIMDGTIGDKAIADGNELVVKLESMLSEMGYMTPRIEALVVDRNGYICRTYEDYIASLKFLRKLEAKRFLESIWPLIPSILRSKEECDRQGCGLYFRLTEAGILLAGTSPMEERKKYEVFYYNKKEFELN